MKTRNIIVIGASAGGFEAFKTLIGDLPPDLQASVFIVWHMAPDIRGVLPQVLNRTNSIYAAHAYDGESIEPNRIYVAPPDHHLLVEEGHVRLTKGPKENRFRPAVDPLFRSAAYAYHERVIGVVLSGALDDGTSGLWTIKHRGGVAVVQDPQDADVPSMPENALREVNVDHVVSIGQMAQLLTRLSREPLGEDIMVEHSVEEDAVVMENGHNKPQDDKLQEDEKLSLEIRVAKEASGFEAGIMKLGELTPFTCPDCHGVLLSLKDGPRSRFRCHTGHAFSADSLLAAVTEKIEDSLYNAIRGVEESVMLLNHMGDHFAEINQPRLAALFFQKAKEAEARTHLVRQVVLSHEQLSKDSLRQESEIELETEDEEQL